MNILAISVIAMWLCVSWNPTGCDNNTKPPLSSVDIIARGIVFVQIFSLRSFMCSDCDCCDVEIHTRPHTSIRVDDPGITNSYACVGAVWIHFYSRRVPQDFTCVLNVCFSSFSQSIDKSFLWVTLLRVHQAPSSVRCEVCNISWIMLDRISMCRPWWRYTRKCALRAKEATSDAPSTSRETIWRTRRCA